MKIKERHKGYTIWVDKDAEGRRVYFATGNWADGTPDKPSGESPIYSLAALRQILREDKAQGQIELKAPVPRQWELPCRSTKYEPNWCYVHQRMVSICVAQGGDIGGMQDGRAA